MIRERDKGNKGKGTCEFSWLQAHTPYKPTCHPPSPHPNAGIHTGEAEWNLPTEASRKDAHGLLLNYSLAGHGGSHE